MLSEEQIRPGKLREKQASLYEADVKRFSSRLHEFTPSDCPACGSASHEPRYKKMGLSYSECNTCNTIFTNPRPTAAILREYYQHSENYRFWAEQIFPSTEKTRKEKIFVPRAQLLKRICSEHGISCNTFLEIGPGFGTFCEVLMEEGVFGAVMAVEPTPELADALEKKGIRALREFVEDVSLNDIADVVAAFEVIEHILDPGPFLDKCSAFLKKNGLLFLTCPNGKGFDNLVLGADAPAVDFEHVTLFNPGSLGALLERKGFRILLSETPGLLDTDIVRNRLLESGELRNRNPLFDHMLCRHWDEFGEKLQHKLKEWKLSGNMMIIAQKQ